MLAGAGLVVGLTFDRAGSIDAAPASLLDLANATGSSALSLSYPAAQTTAAPAAQPPSCATTPAAPGCDELSAIARAMGDVLQTCTRQPDAGVCPQVTGPGVQPPGNLLDPAQLQQNPPADRLWFHVPGPVGQWLTITPAVSETCGRDRDAVGCGGVRQTLETIPRFQRVCREQPGSPACGGAPAPGSAPELTTGKPTTTQPAAPLFFRYAELSIMPSTTLDMPAITGVLPPALGGITVIGPPQSPTGPLEPQSLFRFSDTDLSFTAMPTPAPKSVYPFVLAGADPSLGSTPVDMRGVFSAPPAVPTIDLVQSADTFQVTSGGLNQSIQIMIVVTINEVMQAGAKDDEYASRLIAPQPVFRTVAWNRSPRGPLAAPESPLPIGAPSAAESAQQKSPVQVFITSLGTSTGEAFEMQAFSADGASVQLRGDGVVVQPLNDDNARRAQQQMQQQAKRASARASSRLIGYCLEFLRLPPPKGLMFQVANNGLQQKFAPVRRILEASRLVRAAGQLVPDSEPEGYFHSISQWAIWTREQNFNQRSYGDAFVGHTRKNFEAAGGRWSDATEQVVRKVVPSRWNDITKILQRAGAL